MTRLRASSPSLVANASVIVIGAGPTGLSAAFHLGKDTLLLEQHERVGGWCRSLEQGGFTFDYAGHILFSNDPYVHELYEKLLGENVHWQDAIEARLAGALAPAAKPMGPNARFGYVLRGGFQALMDAFVPHLRGKLRLGARAARISAEQRTVTLANGPELPFSELISTMPLPQLVRALGDEVPDELLGAARGLRHISVRCVNLGVGRAALTDKQWIDYPGDTVFHRIFAQGNASPHCNPPGGFGLTCEIAYSPHEPLPCDGDALIQRCISDCRRVGMLRDDDPIWVANQIDMPVAYVVSDHARDANVALIREWLELHDIFSVGRYGAWEYRNSDHAFLAGRDAALHVRSRRRAAAWLPVDTGAAGRRRELGGVTSAA